MILKERMGDCKDKTLLLTAWLRALGHEAYPLLVSVRSPWPLEELLPTPYHFDHVLVAMKVEAGGWLFLDPTLERSPGLPDALIGKQGLLLSTPTRFIPLDEAP